MSITESKSIWRARSHSILSMDNDTTLSCVEEFLNLFFINDSLLKDLSPVATVTGRVRNMRIAMMIIGKRHWSFSCVILFNKSIGLTLESPGLMLAEWTCLRWHSSDNSLSLLTSWLYSLQKSLSSPSKFSVDVSGYIYRNLKTPAMSCKAWYLVARPARTLSMAL